jgi:hypothetical protein
LCGGDFGWLEIGFSSQFPKTYRDQSVHWFAFRCESVAAKVVQHRVLPGIALKESPQQSVGAKATIASLALARNQLIQR